MKDGPEKGEEIAAMIKNRKADIKSKEEAEIVGPTNLEKGLRKWGKKNKKLKDKNPYADWESRERENASNGIMVAKGKKGNRNNKHKANFVRLTLPHHPTYEGPEI
mmetsp:Transcript_1163/g.1798  ORF Transcript_1163/g.1798 Transcript_1163/m.1798 type:complete len:106 (-) Transcript_1163:13-330(-)